MVQLGWNGDAGASTVATATAAVKDSLSLIQFHVKKRIKKNITYNQNYMICVDRWKENRKITTDMYVQHAHI